jgi:hypothetical protein
MEKNLIDEILIPFDNNYTLFFTEEKLDIVTPVSDYYFKLHDLSINLIISIK